MKRLFALTLALIMVLSLATVAFADDVSGVGDHASETGSITINGASTESNTYKLYKMLLLESYNTASGAYSYKAENDWKEFLASADAAPYMATDTDGYVTWIWTAPTNLPEDDTTTPRTEAEAKAKFAKLAMAYAERKDLTPQRTTANSGDYVNVEGGIMFEDLTLGYYLIDSTMGALCGLTTTAPDVVVSAKNSAPTIDKQVQEDSTGHWGAANTEGIGEKVEYRVTIDVTGGAQNYALHDTMTSGLTFNPDSVSVAMLNGTTETPVSMAGNYEIVTSCTDGCTFEIQFTDTFCNGLKNGDNIVVYYDATLNENAVIAGAGDNNMAKLEFGEDHYTTQDSVTTHTYGIEIIKTNETGTTLLDGAEFYIYDSLEGGNLIPVLETTDADGNTVYKVADKTKLPEDKPNGDIIKVTNGQIKVVGFDNGTYYLQEETAPEGYNQLSSRQGFTVNNGNLYATFVENVYSAGTGVQVKNKTGTVLPSTGAMGTTMFLTFGSFVVLATGVLLITKKRMTMIEE